MLIDVNAITLAGLLLGAFGLVYSLIRWVSKPIMVMSFDSVDVTTQYAEQRVVERIQLKSPDGPKKLHAGLNDFYITITEGVVRYHTMGEASTLTPILRSSEDIFLFRVQVRLVGQRITRFDQTNLSKAKASLRWRRVN